MRPYLRPITLGRGRPIVVARRRVINKPTNQITRELHAQRTADSTLQLSGIITRLSLSVNE